MPVLVLLEHDAHGIKQSSRSAITAARGLGDIHVLVIGSDTSAAAAAAARLQGVTKVIVADSPAFAHVLAESAAALLLTLTPGYSHLLAAATAFGKNILPRAAALLDVQPIGDIVAVVDTETFVRPIYAGNALATVRSLDPIKVVTVRASSFEPSPAEGGDAPIETARWQEIPATSAFVSAELTSSERPELAGARVVISGGRGMGSGTNFTTLLDPIADRLGAAVGASRAAVDAGFAPNDYQVGQTGKIVAPDLYIAVGISGAIQHLAGMKDSKVIVAINKDGDAPIFQIADYGLVQDLFTALPELAAELRRPSA